MPQPPRIAFASIHDPDDISKWSGTYWSMYHGLRRSGAEVAKVAPLHPRGEFISRLRAAMNRRMLGREYDRWRDPTILADIGAQIAREAAGRGCDVVFAPSSLPVAQLAVDRPKVFWTDSTFAGMIGFYAEFTNLHPEVVRWGHAMERQALATSDLAVYSSQWAVDSAVTAYGADRDRLLVVPFGPNFDQALTPAEARSAVLERRLDPVRLLFLGVDWQRKGGATACAVAAELVRRGLEAELLVVGCDPPPEALLPFVHPLGFVSKRSPEGKRRLVELLLRSHFLILPTIADCTPCVFSEANAFALPVLTTAVGGVPSVVREGVNGHLFALDAPASAWADVIAAYRDDPLRYRRAALSAYDEYATRLNWDAAIGLLRRRMDALIR